MKEQLRFEECDLCGELYVRGDNDVSFFEKNVCEKCFNKIINKINGLEKFIHDVIKIAELESEKYEI